MSKIFKPRRAQKTTMSSVKSNTVLSAGEMFVEFDGPVGQSQAAIKFGDGTSVYSALPYALKNVDVSTSAITITADSSQTSTAALNNVASNATTGALIGSLKQAISLTKSELTSTIDDHTTSLNNITYGIKKYTNTDGYCTSITLRTKAGADTVINFKSIGTSLVFIAHKNSEGTNSISTTNNKIYLLISTGGVSTVEVAYNISGGNIVSKNGNGYDKPYLYLVKATGSSISFNIRATTYYTNKTYVSIFRLD